MNSKIVIRASALVLNLRRSRSSHSRVAKKLSHIALSYRHRQPTPSTVARPPPCISDRRPRMCTAHRAQTPARGPRHFVRLYATRRFAPGKPPGTGFLFVASEHLSTSVKGCPRNRGNSTVAEIWILGRPPRPTERSHAPGLRRRPTVK
jgi:hypothetical protein